MRPLENDTPTRIYVSPIEVRQKLKDIGLPDEIIVRAAQSGFIEKSNSNIFDPRTAGGYDAWRYPTRVLRESLHHTGGRLEDPRNLPLVILDEYRTIFTVSSGDQQTGSVFGAEPKTKNEKGSVLKAVIEKDFSQPDLFGDPIDRARFVQTREYPIWILLLHITGVEIKVEVSRPRSLDRNAQIDSWRERIIMNVVPPDSITDSIPEEDLGPDILPSVKLKI
jgi:hypothetical protein